MTNKIIYYYQTLTTLGPVLSNPKIVTHIHLSSIHFGLNQDGTPYIHLNDHPPNDPTFDKVWEELKDADSKGIKIVLMVGGAGGAFGDLFSNFDIYYKLLHDTIKDHPVITGIDLDVEEVTDINKIRMLINRLDDDFGNDFIISMAPVAYSLEFDESGFGGFVYKDLYNTPEGQRVDYFNGQFYGCFNFESYDRAVKNGYPADKINIGMISGDFASNNFDVALNEIKSIKNTYPDMGGVFVWEYFDAPPGAPTDPEQWAQNLYNVLNPKDNESDNNVTTIQYIKSIVYVGTDKMKNVFNALNPFN